MESLRYGKIRSAAIHGIDGISVDIEVALLPGLPVFEIVGLGDSAIRESRNRIHAAISTSGFKFPVSRVTTSLAPAWLRKEGSAFDLPIALAILMASGQLRLHTRFRSQPPCAFGELGLDGQMRRIPGVFNRTVACLESNPSCLVLPIDNLAEARLADPESVPTKGVTNLKDAVEFLRTGSIPICQTDQSSNQPASSDPMASENNPSFSQGRSTGLDLSAVCGQPAAVRALTIAASGWHHLLLLGSPGSGKTMLASTIPGLLPALSMTEARLVTRIYSAANQLSGRNDLIRQRPFCAPHYSITRAALAGGGSSPTPGLCSQAHLGVLFIDEMTEMDSATIDVLRQPLEEHQIMLSRLRHNLVFPADFLLVAAANPCRCGEYYEKNQRCRCSPDAINRHLGKISGPLLDRIDLSLPVIRPKPEELAQTIAGLGTNSNRVTSAQVRQQVERCWKVQLDRCQSHQVPQVLNGRQFAADLTRIFEIEPDSLRLAELAANRLSLSVRGFHKVLRVARTIADLDQSSPVQPSHVSEAVSYRIDRKGEGT